MFDAVLSIGVIHHFSTHKRRTKAIQELARILKPGGRIMIYVWAMEQRLRKVYLKKDSYAMLEDIVEKKLELVLIYILANFYPAKLLIGNKTSIFKLNI